MQIFLQKTKLHSFLLLIVILFAYKNTLFWLIDNYIGTSNGTILGFMFLISLLFVLYEFYKKDIKYEFITYILITLLIFAQFFLPFTILKAISLVLCLSLLCKNKSVIFLMLFTSLPMLYYYNVTFGYQARLLQAQVISHIFYFTHVVRNGTQLLNDNYILDITAKCTGILNYSVIFFLNIIYLYYNKQKQQFLISTIVCLASFFVLLTIHNSSLFYIHNILHITSIDDIHSLFVNIITALSCLPMFYINKTKLQTTMHFPGFYEN